MLTWQKTSRLQMSISARQITSYVSTDIVPKIYMSVNTPRDATGLVSGKPKRYFCTQYSKWATEKHLSSNIRK